MSSLPFITGKQVGIWGYGTTGKSLLARCQKLNPASLHLFDAKPFAPELAHDLATRGISVYTPNTFAHFRATCEVIIPSPGIDLRPYPELHNRIVAELDLFHALWQRPYIGITGTIGKTSVTSLLVQSLQHDGLPVYEGGNIGTGMLDLIEREEPHALAVLELSSFQLEHAHPQPDLAIITNIYHNHLDRHGTFAAYTDAKLRLIEQQAAHQKALLPLALSDVVRSRSSHKPFAWFSVAPVPALQLPDHDVLYTLEGNEVIHYQAGIKKTLGSLPNPLTSFAENWLIIMAARDLLNYQPDCTASSKMTIPEHRLAPIGTYRGITFYNDSKSTIPEATIAAVRKLAPAPVVLFLGGLSKGVDRSALPSQLAPFVRTIICFGAEAEQLASWSRAAGVTSSAYPTLEAAFAGYLQSEARSGDQALLSPSGSSFDLFRDYKARGARFVELVKELSASDH